MNIVTAPCYLCAAAAERSRVGGGRPENWVECEVCGQYYVSLHLVEALTLDENKPYLQLLANHVRQTNDRGSDVPHLTTENWRVLADGQRTTPVSTKIRRLQELLARESTHIGSWVKPERRQLAARVGSVSSEELDTLIAYLRDRGQVEVQPQGTPDGTGGWVQTGAQYRLTVVGWELLEPTGGAGVPGTCFVAMSFDPTLLPAYDSGLRAAVEDDCGLTVVRVDRVQHNEKIDDLIIASIRSAQFLVADVTLQRAGVYFEAGWAMGLGKVVIWSCREDDLANVHFNTRQFNHIVWADPADLRAKLAARIRATVSLAPRL